MDLEARQVELGLMAMAVTPSRWWRRILGALDGRRGLWMEIEGSEEEAVTRREVGMVGLGLCVFEWVSGGRWNGDGEGKWVVWEDQGRVRVRRSRDPGSMDWCGLEHGGVVDGELA